MQPFSSRHAAPLPSSSWRGALSDEKRLRDIIAAVYSISKRIDLLTYLTYLQMLSGVTGIWEPPGISSSVVPPTEVCHEITWKEKSPHLTPSKRSFSTFQQRWEEPFWENLRMKFVLNYSPTMPYSSWAWKLWKVYERLTSPTNILSAPVMQTCVVSLLFEKWSNSCKGPHYRRARGAFCSRLAS